MILKITLTFLLATIAGFFPLFGAPIFGTEVTLENGTVLQKAGSGTFRWTVFKVYDGAFYSAEKAGPGTAPSTAMTPKHLELYYHRSIPAEKLVSGGDAILKRNVAATDYAALEERLKIINAAYIDVLEGDRYSLTFIPSIGTQLRHNGKLLVTIPGEDFAEAYFKIWLGPNPISQNFRDSLLGVH